MRLLCRAGHFPVGRPSQHARQGLRLRASGTSRCRRRWSSCKAAWPWPRRKSSRSCSAAPWQWPAASTRTYSGSGGAFSLAFFNAMLYENRPLGGCLRQAKNFLLAYSLLKEKRLGKNAKLTGANLRTAWAFTLWGDPMLQPAGAGAHRRPAGAVRPWSAATRSSSTCRTRRIKRPLRRLPLARCGPTPAWPACCEKTGRTASIWSLSSLPRSACRGSRRVRRPDLRSRLPDKNWVFCWDARRRVGYLLVTPRPRDQGELRFHVEWDEQEADIRPAEEARTGMTKD